MAQVKREIVATYHQQGTFAFQVLDVAVIFCSKRWLII
jgi:hypothetical protein